MNYVNLYRKAIDFYLTQRIEEGVYTEKHHIVPRHKGGTNDSSNMVVVTYRQHVLLHLLLWKAYENPYDKMAYQLMRGQISSVEGRREALRLSKLGKKWSPEFREHIMECRKEYYSSEEFLKNARSAQAKAVKLKSDRTKEKSDTLVKNSERNEEWLHKTTNKSKYKFVSPEGLVFDSPIYAAKYYGQGVKHIDIENWCKRKRYGWNTIPELAKI